MLKLSGEAALISIARGSGQSTFDACACCVERYAMTFSADEDFACQLDAEDPLHHFQERFHLPLGADGKPIIYLAGNSLGPMPRSAKEAVDQELDDWAKLGVDAHLEAKTPWYTYHETLREPVARLVGARPN